MAPFIFLFILILLIIRVVFYRLLKQESFANWQKKSFSILLLLFAFYLFIAYAYNIYAGLFFLGMFFASLGDFVLMDCFKIKKRLEVGILLFFAMQLCYFLAMVYLLESKYYECLWYLAISMIVLVLLLYVLASYFKIKNYKLLKVSYLSVLIIQIVMASILYRLYDSGIILLFASILFFVSDLLIVIDNVLKIELRDRDLYIWITYVLAQALYISSSMYIL